jgi:hypothetical protein
MRRLFLFIGVVLGFSAGAQVLEVPTLQSKGLNGKVKTVAWYQYGFVAEKGLILTKEDLETYDDQGRLVSIVTKDLSQNQFYKALYKVDKKGLLQSVEIVNPDNNLALRTTSYEYKKGLLVKTTQVQGPNTLVKEYAYNKKDQLTEVKVSQNGTLSLTESYELNDDDLRTKISRLLPGETEARVASTFSYTEENGQRTSVENRFTEQGEFKITKVIDLATKRDLTETTQKVSTGQQGHNRQLFEDDANSNWIKGEVLDEQFGRPRLVLRKITYADGTVTGRENMLFPDDYRAQYIRKYSQKQIAVNGKVYYTGSTFNLDYTTDQLTYLSGLNAWIVLKGYDDNNNMSKWGEAEIMAGGKNVVLWAASTSGIHVFNNGKKLLKDTSADGYSGYEVGGSTLAYVRGGIHKSFIAENTADHAGKVQVADLTADHYNWAKASDSTYVLVNRGKSVGLQKQVEDEAGNKLAMRREGFVYTWYLLPEFRKRFDEGKEGEVFPAREIFDPKDLARDNLFQADFSSFSYNKELNRRYSLRSSDGLKITGIAEKSVKTPDNELIAYFPLTKQYLRMEGYYTLDEDKEWPDQKVTVLSDSTAYAYYIYNEGKSITFYKPGEKFSKYAFNSHKLDNNERRYGAVLYDSLNNVSYSMTYDLDASERMGPMRMIPFSSQQAHILKLEADRWVIFVKGVKLGDYDFSKLTENGQVVHFYKDESNVTRAYYFDGFKYLKPGEVTYSGYLSDKEVFTYLKEFNIDLDLKKKDKGENEVRKSSTYDREDNLFYLRDANGSHVQKRLAWNVSFGSESLIAYDTVSLITYELVDYFNSENVVEGEVKVLISKSKDGFLKWDKNSVSIAVGGEYQQDVSRAYITENGDDPMWKELFYDQSSKKSYIVEYPSDSSFYSAELEPLPDNEAAAYLYKTENGYRVIVKGKRDDKTPAESYRYQGDLVWVYKDKSGRNHGLRFEGYEKAERMEVLSPEVIPPADLPALMKAIANSKN